jgi:small-conductance mechanosensitive channel
MSRLIWFTLFLIPIFAFGENPSEIQPPDPMNLQSNWWEFFKGEGEKFQNQSKAFQDKLALLKETLNEKEHAELLHQMDKIILNLNMLQELKGKKEELKPIPLLLLEKYDINQLLEVVKNLGRVQNKIIDQKDDLTRQQKLQAQNKSELDSLYLNYGELPKGSPARLKTGMSIIAARSDLALIAIHIEQLKKRIQFLEKEKEKLNDELKFAEKNLSFDNLTAGELEKGVQQKQNEVEKGKAQLLKLEKSAFAAKKQEPENIVLQRLWEQRILSQSISQGIARADLIIQQIKQHLYFIAKQIKTYSTPQLQALITEWKESVADSKRDISLWENMVREELDRIGKEIAAISEGEQKKMEMALNLHLEIDKSLLAIQELKGKLEDTTLLLKQIETVLIQERTIFETWTIVLEKYLFGVISTFNEIANTKVFEVRERPITLLNLFQALLIVIGTFIFSKLFRKMIFSQKHFEKNVTQSTQFILSKSIHYLLLLIGFLIAFSWMGFDFTNFAIIAGALGVGVGFGLQSLVNNIISGFMILFQRNLKIGDIIEIESTVIGRVAEVNLQSTRIHSFEGIDVIVPNSNLTTQRVINWTLHDHCRRFRIPFSVAYGTGKEFLSNVILEATKKLAPTVHGDVRYPDPQIWFAGFGNSALDFELVVWVNLLIAMPHGSAKSTYLWMLDNVLSEHEIDIPYNQMDVRIKEMAKG